MCGLQKSLTVAILFEDKYRKLFDTEMDLNYFLVNILKGGKKKKNYSLHLIKSFTKYDRVVFEGKRGIITSMMSTGYATVKTLGTGERIHEKSVVSVKRLVFLEHGHTLMFELNK